MGAPSVCIEGVGSPLISYAFWGITEQQTRRGSSTPLEGFFSGLEKIHEIPAGREGAKARAIPLEGSSEGVGRHNSNSCSLPKDLSSSAGLQWVEQRESRPHPEGVRSSECTGLWTSTPLGSEPGCILHPKVSASVMMSQGSEPGYRS